MDEKKKILYLQEAERRRIAEELHDTTVQELVHLLQQLELATLYLEEDSNKARLEIVSARKQIKNTIHGIRDTIYNLRPMTFDDIGWEAVISHFYDTLLQNTDIQIHFDIDSLNTNDGITAISMYRIMREACQNIIKHSNAKNMWVSLKVCDDLIRLRIKDDGIGFQVKKETNHFGIQYMKERVLLLSGKINIETGCNGTEILIEVPK